MLRQEGVERISIFAGKGKQAAQLFIEHQFKSCPFGEFKKIFVVKNVF